MSIVDLVSKLQKLSDDKIQSVENYIDSLIEEEPIQERKTPKFGSGKGMFIMTEDFDAPLEDFKDYM